MNNSEHLFMAGLLIKSAAAYNGFQNPGSVAMAPGAMTGRMGSKPSTPPMQTKPWNGPASGGLGFHDIVNWWRGKPTTASMPPRQNMMSMLRS